MAQKSQSRRLVGEPWHLKNKYIICDEVMKTFIWKTPQDKIVSAHEIVRSHRAVFCLRPLDGTHGGVMRWVRAHPHRQRSRLFLLQEMWWWYQWWRRDGACVTCRNTMAASFHNEIVVVDVVSAVVTARLGSKQLVWSTKYQIVSFLLGEYIYMWEQRVQADTHQYHPSLCAWKHSRL